MQFNDLVAQDERVEKVILPLRDGLTIIRKKD
jgi:predicted O-methyltransferase YrrM